MPSPIRVGPFPATQSTVNVTKHLEFAPACERVAPLQSSEKKKKKQPSVFSARIIRTFTCLTSHLSFFVYFAGALALALFLVFVHIAEPVFASVPSEFYKPTHTHKIFMLRVLLM